ncbi:MAG: ATP-dependent helicase [Cyanobacteria bacterium DS2.3.42]|nr:ATP-dependent helicase [Cyanobacteria bacterium DS2.3.42]
MELRLYQEKLKVKARKELRNSDSVCVVLPTGGGKTVIFCAITKAAIERAKSVWIAVHREELLDQTCKALRRFGIPHGVIAAGVPECTAYVQVAMIQTLQRRLSRWTAPDVLIVDECHHAPAKTYADIIEWLPKQSKSLGFTATPERLDGKGLGKHYKVMIEGPSVKELIEQGWLVPPEVFGVDVGFNPKDLHTKYGDYIKEEVAAMLDTPKITGDVVRHYRKFADGTYAVAFCINVAHAEHVAKQFSDAGIPATAVYGALDKAERRLRLNAFREGRIKVLTSADLISEGFDLPRIETAILLRPTKSLALYLQQVGRALRTDEENGKTKAIIIDHVMNSVIHGLPDMERDWSLEGRTKRKRSTADDEDIVCTTCKECFRVFEGKDKCPYCGWEKEKVKRERAEVEQVDGDLVHIGAQNNYVQLSAENFTRVKNAKTKQEVDALIAELKLDEGWLKKLVLSRAKSLAELREAAKKLGYKERFAEHRYKARHGEKALEEALELERKERIKEAECLTKRA